MADPIQTGVDAGTIAPATMAVLRAWTVPSDSPWRRSRCATE